MSKKTLGNKILTKALIIKGRSDVKCMLENAKDAKGVNEKTLFNILKTSENSEYGRKYDFANIHSVKEYQEKVPLCTFSDLDEYVNRIYFDNEQNVLTSNKVVGFSTTSGSVGKPKHIPITDEQIEIYTKYTVTRMLALADDYWRKKTGKGISHGFGLPLLEAFSGDSPHGLPQTNIVDLAARKYGALYPYILLLPLGGLFKLEEVESEYVQSRFGLEETDALYIFSVFANSVQGVFEYIQNNWEMLVDDIEKGIVNDSVYVGEETRKALAKIMKPNPERAAQLRKEFEKGFDSTILKRIWPNMKFMNMIGTSPAYEPYIETITGYADGIPIDFSIYGASEGLFAAAYECGNKGQLLLLDSCFYEFIEQTGEEDESAADDGKDESNLKILTVDELEVGKNYEIIITNTSGLYRYRFKDVITVLGFLDTCPVVNFAYRKGQLVNVVAEKLNLEQMLAAVKLFEEKTGLAVAHWSVTISRGGAGGNYLVYFEGQNNEDYSAYSKEMDDALSYANTRYAEFRQAGLIAPAQVCNQKPGTHEAWRQMKIDAGVSPAQVKQVTVLDTDEKKEFFGSRLL